MIERHPWIAALDPAPLGARLRLSERAPVLVVLPGSRSSEVSRLMQPFADTVGRLLQKRGDLEIVMPVMPSVRLLIEQRLASWPKRPHLVEGEEDKFRAFKLARAALAASGTVTLELALTGTPMVVGYRVDAVMAPILRRLIVAPSVVLPSLVLGERAFPEFHQETCTPANLAGALDVLMDDSPARAAQLAALARIPAALQVPGCVPSEAAAGVVLDYAENGRGWPRGTAAAR